MIAPLILAAFANAYGLKYNADWFRASKSRASPRWAQVHASRVKETPNFIPEACPESEENTKKTCKCGTAEFILCWNGDTCEHQGVDGHPTCKYNGEEKWKKDTTTPKVGEKCGDQNYPKIKGKDGNEFSAECNPYGNSPCCSGKGWCGSTEDHCRWCGSTDDHCKGGLDYRPTCHASAVNNHDCQCGAYTGRVSVCKKGQTCLWGQMCV